MNSIYVRKANLTDLAAIMQIITQAKALLKADGNPQWQEGYPNTNTIEADIKNNIGNVLVVNDQVAGYAVMTTDPEPTYAVITEGHWQNDHEAYGTIHRIAISPDFKGLNLARIFIITLISKATDHGIYNFRIDTHKVNQRMQHIATSLGFIKRGQILVDTTLDPHRIGFELNLKH
ncbi:N-acetyltransferase family protein [Fructilactobacillus sp. Tb1]|uniref:GNAT family N-acetyltransferase n=1 Tax=Fructilactobacillus sp. Tb1 TaxID=3422304 RepID=UPI003D273441